MNTYIPIVAHFANISSQNELTSVYTRSILKCEGYKYLLFHTLGKTILFCPEYIPEISLYDFSATSVASKKMI